VRTFAIAAVSLLAACATSRERTRPVPLARPTPAAPIAETSRDVGSFSAADRSPPAPSLPGDARAPMAGDSGASVSLRSFRMTSETRTQPEPEPEQFAQPAEPAEPAANWSEPLPEGYWYPERAHEPWIPVNTVVGASIGAAYDASRCCGHGYRGTLVGAGIGLTLDLGRLFWH
jgi:hypothetical protein